MSTNTGIEWTDATWNPIRGCSRVSEGCRNCYAEKVAYRFSDEGAAYHGLVGMGGKWNGQIKFVEEHLLDPLRWKKPRRIFVNSMSDLFHENVTDEMLDRIFAVMALSPQHTFQVLTKRPERMLAYCGAKTTAERVVGWLAKIATTIKGVELAIAHKSDGMEGIYIPNVWLGVSVENQKAADERIPLLLQTPAAVRFISAEPLLGPVSLEELPSFSGIGRHLDSLNNAGCAQADISTKLDWVISGGESGPGARPMHPDWARGLRDQCVAAGVPFFFKQWGEFTSEQCPGVEVRLDHLRPGQCVTSGIKGHHTLYSRVGKKAAGHLLDGKEWHQFPVVAHG